MWPREDKSAAVWCATDRPSPRRSITGDESCLITFQSETGKKPESGVHGGGKPRTLRINQDTAVVSLLPENSGLFLSVFDGHGVHGREISRAAAVSTLSTVSKEAAASANGEAAFAPASVLARALPAANDALPKEEARQSGTTAIVAILKASSVTVGCVGDSRCVLGRAAESGGAWDAVDLSVDQKPDAAEERARIESAGGKVSGGDGDGEVARVWHDGVGVAVSRSLGDTALKNVGVIAEPVLTERALDERDACLLLASDGLWEFVSSGEAIAAAQACRPDADAAGRALCRLAARRWRRESGKGYRDDISVICVFLRDDVKQVSAVDAVVRSIAQHGTAGLGANLHDLEGADNAKPPMEEDEETADEEDDEDDEQDEAALLSPTAHKRVEFKRRLTIVAPKSPDGSPAKDSEAPPAATSDAGSGCCAIS